MHVRVSLVLCNRHQNTERLCLWFCEVCGFVKFILCCVCLYVVVYFSAVETTTSLYCGIPTLARVLGPFHVILEVYNQKPYFTLT